MSTKLQTAPTFQQGPLALSSRQRKVTQRPKKQAQRKNVANRTVFIGQEVSRKPELNQLKPSDLEVREVAVRPKPEEDVNEQHSKPAPEIELKPQDAAAAVIANFGNDCQIKRAGEFLIGPIQGTSPVKCISQYIARKENADQFYVIKILTLKNAGEKESMDDIQGKTLIHTEHSLLSLLQNEFGVVHEHGLFKDTIKEPQPDGTVKEIKRLCLVLDCFITHDFSPKFSNITNIQYHVIKEKKLAEKEAIRIFYKVVQIVERLHKLNIVHRDLKLGNFILNKDTKEISLANFCLGKHLSKEREMLKDQRGSPAYISPDVINGKPYLGKPSDMWALGVSLYTMLYGQFPFYDHSPSELFRKIKLGEFQIPVGGALVNMISDVNVSSETQSLIKSLLVMDPEKRETASGALERAKKIIAAEKAFLTDSDLQVVPDCPVAFGDTRRPMKRSLATDKFPSGCDNDILDFANYLMRSSESDDFEPSRNKLFKRSGSGSAAGFQGLENLEEFQAMYKACTVMMKKAAALFSVDDGSSAPSSPLSTSSSSSNNGFSKCAPPNFDDESARVPSFSFSSSGISGRRGSSSSSSSTGSGGFSSESDNNNYSGQSVPSASPPSSSSQLPLF